MRLMRMLLVLALGLALTPSLGCATGELADEGSSAAPLYGEECPECPECPDGTDGDKEHVAYSYDGDHECPECPKCDEPDGDACALTQGFWRNHEEAWPVLSLTLGQVLYTQAELLAILRTPVAGNGLIALAHQLIAAKLNVAAGAGNGDIDDVIDDADQMIGALTVPPVGAGYLHPRVTSALNDELDEFNNSGDDCEAPAP